MLSSSKSALRPILRSTPLVGAQSRTRLVVALRHRPRSTTNHHYYSTKLTPSIDLGTFGLERRLLLIGVTALIGYIASESLKSSNEPLECESIQDSTLDAIKSENPAKNDETVPLDDDTPHSYELPDELKRLGLSYDAKPKIDLDDESIPMRIRMVEHIQSLQDNICQVLETLEASSSSSDSSSSEPNSQHKKFHSSYYLRDENKGFGDSRVLQNGKTFEKAGCNISVINSTLSVAAIKQMRSERFTWWDGQSELPYFVAGISLVVHPTNPHAPTIHFNYRYFEIKDPNNLDGIPKAWWFGGGTDLTPSYFYEKDVKHFHQAFKKACDRHDQTYYPKFKKWCDTYFYIPFRGETRGFGGIFFDDLSNSQGPKEIFDFVRDCSKQFLRVYYPIMKRRMSMEFTEDQKRWQQLRRGRYVEFNMNIDRGVRFGLAMKQPRVESILMSLPLTARWEYETELGTKEGSPEKKVLDILRNPVEWV